MIDDWFSTLLKTATNITYTTSVLIQFTGWFRRTSASQRKRWSIFLGWYHQLGHWMCGSQLAWRLYKDIKIRALDFTNSDLNKFSDFWDTQLIQNVRLESYENFPSVYKQADWDLWNAILSCSFTRISFCFGS